MHVCTDQKLDPQNRGLSPRECPVHGCLSVQVFECTISMLFVWLRCWLWSESRWNLSHISPQYGIRFDDRTAVRRDAGCSHVSADLVHERHRPVQCTAHDGGHSDKSTVWWKDLCKNEAKSLQEWHLTLHGILIVPAIQWCLVWRSIRGCGDHVSIWHRDPASWPDCDSCWLRDLCPLQVWHEEPDDHKQQSPHYRWVSCALLLVTALLCRTCDDKRGGPFFPSEVEVKGCNQKTKLLPLVWQWVSVGGLVSGRSKKQSQVWGRKEPEREE
jgi:hypothetical protein